MYSLISLELIFEDHPRKVYLNVNNLLYYLLYLHCQILKTVVYDAEKWSKRFRTTPVN